MKTLEAVSFLKDALERNHACIQGGVEASRRANIHEMPLLVPRMSELAMLGFAKRMPRSAERMLGNNFNDSPVRYVGGGSENTTVTDGTTVTKVFRKSTRWSEDERQSKAEQMRSGHKFLAQYLGSFVVPQEVSVGSVPYRMVDRAVLTRQMRVDFHDTGIFRAYDGTINEERIHALDKQYPGVSNDLGSLAEKGIALYENTGLLVDTSGLNNIVMADRYGAYELTCLDGTPAVVDQQSVVDRIIGQMTALKEATA